jgi:hypothetical protein
VTSLALVVFALGMPAMAATVQARISGFSEAHAVVLIGSWPSGWDSVSCGLEGGVWRCDPLESPGEAPGYSVIVDDRMFTVRMSDDANGLVYLGRQGDGLVQFFEAPELQENSPSRAPGMVIFARVRQINATRAPLLVVRNPFGSAELPCRDDGAYFDDQANDALFLCVGWLPGPENTGNVDTIFVLRSESGLPKPIANVTLPGGAGLRFVHLDAVGERPPDTAPMDLAQVVENKAMAGIAPVMTPVIAPPTVPAVVPVIAPAMVMGAAGVAPGVSPSRLSPLSAVFTVFALMLGLVLGWRLKNTRPGGGPTPGLRWKSTPRAEATATYQVVQSAKPADTTRALVTELSAHYRVIVVDPTGELAPTGCFALRTNDVWDLLKAVDALMASPGAPLAVIISGREALVDAASPTPNALADARQALAGRAVVTVVVHTEGAAG